MNRYGRPAFLARHQDVLQLGASIAFLLGMGLYAAGRVGGIPWLSHEQGWFLIVSVVVAGYMAMTIGANDAANSVSPAVGAGAISMGWALVLGACFEILGALLAGERVLGVVRDSVIDVARLSGAHADVLALVMFTALLAGALWLHAATALGVTVSATHTIIGAMAGAGVAAGGWGLVNWPMLLELTLGWVVSPVLGALVAAGMLYLVKLSITYHTDMAAAAVRVVPRLIAAMAWAFCTYLLLLGKGRLAGVGVGMAFVLGVLAALPAWVLVRWILQRRAPQVDNSKAGVNRLFAWPLVCAAALLSFAHGSNDVANVVAPLSAIYDALRASTDVGASGAKAHAWLLVVGALGIASGVLLYGAGLVRTLGREITELDQMRAWAITMAATLTVIVATQMGVKVSTTHTVVGAIVGVGFLRQLLKVNYARIEAAIRLRHSEQEREQVEAELARFKQAEPHEKRRILADMKRQARAAGPGEGAMFDKRERKALRKAYESELVKRSLVLRIVAAWVATMPVTAGLAAALYAVVTSILS